MLCQFPLDTVQGGGIITPVEVTNESEQQRRAVEFLVAQSMGPSVLRSRRLDKCPPRFDSVCWPRLGKGLGAGHGTQGNKLIMNTFIQKRLPHLTTVFTAFALCSASAWGAGGTVVAWGEDIYYRTGTNVPVTLTNAIAIGAAFSNSLALKADGHLINWGSESSPATNFSNLVAISAAGGHYLLLTADGVVDGFGSWSGRSLQSMPTNIFNATNIVAIGAGDSQNLVLECDGTVLAWGYGYYGTNVPAGLSNVTAIACGEYHSLALKRDGTVVGWGDNSCGQTNVPAGLSGVAIAGGAYHSLALKSDGTVVGWGQNLGGQTNAPADLSNVVAIAAGAFHSLALKSDGTVVAWGANSYGVTNVPAGLSNVIAIASGPVASTALAIVGSAPPACQVPLANSSFGADGFRVSLPTQSGRVYALEYQDALSNGTWTTLPLAAGKGCTLTLRDPTAAGTQRFYRVRQW